VIDFDEVRLGDPNFDVAHFCAYLTLLGCRITAMAQVIDGLRDHFLTAYAARAGWQMDGRFPAFYAYTCLKIAWQLCTGTGVAPRPQAQERRRQAAAMLAQGVAVLERHFPG
jgi:aminoglycoside phosphotransferase (APT) family kinase protein